MKKKELAEKMHDWYLEAVELYGMEFFNPKAIVPFKDLPESQQKLSCYIAEKIMEMVRNEKERTN